MNAEVTVVDMSVFEQKFNTCDGIYGLERTDHIIFRLPFSTKFTVKIQEFKWKIRSRMNPNTTNLELYRKAGVIFIHIPKNGGTSIWSELYGLDSMQVGRFGHMPAELARRIDSVFYQNTLSFAIIRNPVERFVSAFNYLRNNTKWHNDIVGVQPLLQKYSSAIEFADNIESVWERVRKWPHFRPQVEFIRNFEGEIIVDFLIKLECLDSGLRELNERTNICINNIKLNLSNGEKHLPNSEIIENVYSEDVFLWNKMGEYAWNK